MDCDADIVQQRRSVDLIVERLDFTSFERASNGFEGGQVFTDGLRIKCTQPVVVGRHTGAGGLHRIHLPFEVEI